MEEIHHTTAQADPGSADGTNSSGSATARSWDSSPSALTSPGSHEQRRLYHAQVRKDELCALLSGWNWLMMSESMWQMDRRKRRIMYWQNYIDRRWWERLYFEDLVLPVPYPRFRGDRRDVVIKRSEPRELLRLEPGRDLVEWTNSPEKPKERFAFKYGVARETFQRVWNEMNVLKRLQEVGAGTSSVSFPTVHRIVVDDFDGSIGEFPSRWVADLINAVDELHWRFGIFHNDINPTTIWVEEATGNLIITGFGLSPPCNRNFARMDYRRHLSDVDALCVTVYYKTLCTPGKYTRRVEMQGAQIVRGKIYNTHALLRAEWAIKPPISARLTDTHAIQTQLREWRDGRTGGDPNITHWRQAMEPLHGESNVPWEKTLLAADGSGKEIPIPSDPIALGRLVQRGFVYQANWARALPEPDEEETRPVYWEKWDVKENPRSVYISYFNETNYGIYREDKEAEF